MSSDRNRYRILVVEDSATTRDAIKRFLTSIERAEFEVVEAEHGVAALKALGDSDVDLVLTDLSMPEMDGVQLIRQLRARAAFEHVPILLLTSHTDEHKRIEVFRCGATDYVVKPFLPEELEARLMGYLERKRAFETIQESVSQARVTQQSLLPQVLPRLAGASLAVEYVPAEHLSGDFYDFYELEADRLGILVADVSGHGISAALVTFLLAGILKHFAPITPDPEDVLEHSSATFGGKMPEERYATACYALYDPADSSLTYSSAGHVPPILVSGGQVKELTLEGTPLGMGRAGGAQFRRGEAKLRPGDKLLLHTDGILGVVDAKGTPLGSRRLRRLLMENLALAPQALLEAIVELGQSHSASGSFEDDVTLILLQVES